MIHIFLLQWKKLLKRPGLVLAFFGLTLVFVFFMGGASYNSSLTVPVYSHELSQEALLEKIGELNKDDSILFEATDYETIQEKIRMNEVSFAMELEEDGYRFLVGRENEQLPLVDQHVHQHFYHQQRLEDVAAAFPDEEIEIEEFLQLNYTATTDLSGAQNQYQTRILTGMTLYFVMFTILFLQMNLVEEKIYGTWDRLIFSPVSKTKLYLGHLMYYFTVGLLQIGLAFFVLTNVMNIDLGTNYGPLALVAVVYTFTIVALGMLLAALVPSPQSLSVVIPIVATSFAMLGGAFWPLEVVSNRFLLFISNFIPIKHGHQGMMQAINQHASLAELAQPLGILLLMGILLMGVGINLMERATER